MPAAVPEERRLGVLGAGTMGAGIAQVAAEAGFEVLIHDPVDGAVARARDRIGGFLRRKVEKGQLTNDDAIAALGRLHEAQAPESLGREAAFVTVDCSSSPQELEHELFGAVSQRRSDSQEERRQGDPARRVDTRCEVAAGVPPLRGGHAAQRAAVKSSFGDV